MIRRRKSVFLTLWLSYVLILIVPVSVSAVLYGNMENSMVANANRSNLAMLEQVKRIVDNHMQEIDHLTVQIATHPKLQTLWNISEGDMYLQYSEAVAALRNIRSGSGFIDKFYIHLREQDIILSPEMKTDTTTFFNKLLPYRDKDEPQVRSELLSGYHFKTYWPSAAVLDASRSFNVITCAVSLPLGERDNVRATLVMLIEERQIFDLLKQIEWVNSGAMFILDENGQVILSTERGRLPDVLRGMLGDTSGYRNVRLDGRNMMLSYTSGQSEWKYVSLVPESVVLKRVNEIKGLALGLLALALIGGTAVAYAMAYRSYSPIREMVLALTSGKNIERPVIDNEYEFIKSSIAETLAEEKELRKTLEGHVPVLRADFLSRLLKGQAVHSAQENGSLEFMGIRFPHDYVSVVLIEVDDGSGFIREDNEREWALARFVLFNLGSELIGGRGYVVETDRNRLALLLNLPDASDAAERERDALIRRLKQLIEERFRMKITIAVSSIRQGIPEAAACYGEALNALDYRIIHGISSVIYFEEIRDMNRSFYHYPLETEVRLINFMKSGDFDSADRLLDELYEQHVVSSGISPEIGKCLFFDLLSTMLKVLNALKLDEKELFEGTATPVKQIMSSSTGEEMLRKIKEICRLICASVRGARTDQNEQLNERLKRYIEEHCSDNGLCLASIADHFGMTPQYISGFFKKHNGVNLTDYIVSVRVREAKRMLADPNLTVVQIAQQVGYATDIGFIRVFKKHEGITPGKYREMLLQTGEMKNGSSL